MGQDTGGPLERACPASGAVHIAPQLLRQCPFRGRVKILLSHFPKVAGPGPNLWTPCLRQGLLTNAPVRTFKLGHQQSPEDAPPSDPAASQGPLICPYLDSGQSQPEDAPLLLCEFCF